MRASRPQTGKKRRWWIWILLVLVVAGGGGYYVVEHTTLFQSSKEGVAGKRNGRSRSSRLTSAKAT